MTDKQSAYHDIGGLDLGPIPLDVGEYQLWEKRVDATLRLLASKAKLIKVDELRRGIETLGQDVYDQEPYYGKWAQSICKIMIEKGVVSPSELDERMQRIRQDRGLSS
ncbi:MAG: hypothetical protein ACPGVN_00665 [Alphaproteobacteria bacterium]